jgi:hypothetical protein
MVFTNDTKNLFGTQFGSSNLFGNIPTKPPKSPFLYPQNIFNSQQTTQPLFVPTPPPPQTTQPLFVPTPPQTTQPLFVPTPPPPQTTQPTLVQNNELLDKISKQLDILSQKVDYLTNNKDLYVACNLHNHLLIETNCNKINNKSYYAGFSCNNCNISIQDKNRIMYHCKTCKNSEVLFNLCENCIRKSLKM